MSEEHAQQNINEVQHLQLELFRRVRFNELDGERVVNDLLAWRDLWYSVLPTRFPSFFPKEPGDKDYHPYTELSMLRCTRRGTWPADTLYIWTNDEALPQLRKHIEDHWEPSDMVEIIPGADEEMHLAHINGEHDRVLFVWWD